MRKKRKKQTVGKIIIISSSIIMLNLLGVSYAYWNDDLNMTVSVSTGYIKPYFIGDEIKIVGDYKGEIDVNAKDKEKLKIVDDESLGEITASLKKGNTLEIKGWIYPNFNKNIFVKVGNRGTVPIVFKDIEEDDDDEIIKSIRNIGSDRNLIGKDDEAEIKIHIKAGNEKKIEYGDRSFTYKLQYEQGLR